MIRTSACRSPRLLGRSGIAAVEFLDGVQDDAKDMILAENAGMASSVALCSVREPTAERLFAKIHNLLNSRCLG